MSNPILIESIIKREGGSRITLGSTTYHFKPDDTGLHVASVSDPAHIQTLLGIPEGFRMLAAMPAPVAPVITTLTAAPPPPASVEGTGTQPAAPEQDQSPPATVALDQMELGDLRKVFAVELGRAASPRSTKETLIAQIEAVRAERAAQ